jgi:hypothetical protein
VANIISGAAEDLLTSGSLKCRPLATGRKTQSSWAASSIETVIPQTQREAVRTFAKSICDSYFCPSAGYSAGETE